MEGGHGSGRYDIAFSVPCVHRLRFTRDVFGPDNSVLVELLEPSGAERPRVQFWMDENLAAAQPQIKPRIYSALQRHGDRLRLAGRIQMVPGGEAIKNDIHIIERMLKVMNFHDLDRRSYVVVVGGGAVLDAVGFAAAIAHRGIRLVRLPSTTLGQGDSGIGVKNGVNLFHKKNWIGSFAVPWGVINDESLLRSLSQRDFIGGFSEALKVGLLKDRDFVDRLFTDARRIAKRDMQAAGPAIRRSAELHLAHITQGGDPFETNEARPLDFGHWSAHRLEAMTEFELRHGEAVAVGVAIDTVYSSLKLGLPREDAQRVLRCLVEMGFSLDYPVLAKTDEIFHGLEEFRQHLGGRLTLTMLRGIGQPVDVHEVDRRAMRKAVQFVATYARSPGDLATCGA